MPGAPRFDVGDQCLARILHGCVVTIRQGIEMLALFECLQQRFRVAGNARRFDVPLVVSFPKNPIRLEIRVAMPPTQQEVRASGAAETIQRARRQGGPLPFREVAGPRSQP